jgi:hypothetical protein
MLIKTVAFASLLTLALECTAGAQVSNPESPAANNPLKGFRNMNIPDDGGAPLPPPATESKVKLDNAVLQLCLKLKEAKSNPDFCK